jgi:hypothetical protein
MFLFYKGDEKIFGKDLTQGLSVKMKRDAYSYGIQARSLLLKIVSLMIENKIELNSYNYKNPVPILNVSGILGWLVKLNSN